MAKTINTPVDELEELTENTVDSMEAELAEAAAAPKAKKEKKEKVPKEPKIGEGQIGATELADMLGISSRDLRMFLRKKFRDMNAEKGKTYVWTRDSKEVQDIIDAYQAHKAAPRKKAEKVEKAVEAVEAEAPVDLASIDLDDMDV